jgi:hypothetical protein
MIDNKSLIEVKNKSSNKSFGILISSILFFIFSYILIFHGNLKIILLSLSLISLIFSFFKPRIFQVPNIIFIYLGYKIGGVVSPIVMFLIYISTIYPIGFVMRSISSDFTQTKLYKDKKSYWEDYDNANNNLRDQF